MNPDNTGMVKLSLSGIGDNSMSIAATPPKINISALMSCMIGKITARDKIKPVILPLMVFPLILPMGKVMPTIAAKVSPTVKNKSAGTAISLENSAMVRQEPINSQVAPVIPPLDSFQ